MAVKYWVDQMAADADVKIQDRRDELFDMELEKFVAGIVGPQGVKTVDLLGCDMKGPFSVKNLMKLFY
mgnify:CR=1 FL=1